MKTLFIETKRKFTDSDIKLELLDKLPGKTVSLAATIQYIGLIPKVKEYLESKGKKVAVQKGAYYEGHVLGCNSSALDNSAENGVATIQIRHCIEGNEELAAVDIWT